MAEIESGKENIQTHLMLLAMKILLWWLSWIQFGVFKPFVLLYTVACFMTDVIKRLLESSLDLLVSICSFCIKQTVSFTESDNEATKKIKEEAILDYSSENTRDESLLQELYDIYFPGSGSEQPRNLITNQWETIGFQTSNPRLDFRGGGVISIKHLLNFEKHYHHVLEEMRELSGEQKWMLAVISIRVTAFMTSYFDFRADSSSSVLEAAQSGREEEVQESCQFLEEVR
jgi:hypothetical protein